MNGNVETVQQLISDGVDVNEPRFSTQCTPLHLASIAGKRRVVKLLLRNGANVDAEDTDGRTALHHAVVRANVGTTKDLIKARANVNLKAANGHTPLALAAHKGCSELVRMLLDCSADPDSFDAHGRRALHDAVCKGHQDCTDMLLRAGASQICLQTNDNSSMTALGAAICFQRFALIEFLATHDLVDVNMRFLFNESHRTALTYACSFPEGRMPRVEALLKSKTLKIDESLECDGIDRVNALTIAVDLGYLGTRHARGGEGR